MNVIKEENGKKQADCALKKQMNTNLLSDGEPWVPVSASYNSLNIELLATVPPTESLLAERSKHSKLITRKVC